MSGEQRRGSGNPRPESLLAQNFALDLDAMFGLTPEIEQMTQTVEDKKRQVTSNERELMELEYRLRRAEQRLARVSRGNSPSPTHGGHAAATSPTSPTGGSSASQHPLAQRPTYPADRPPTAKSSSDATPRGQQQVPPPPPAKDLPGGYHAGSEYVMVDRSAAQAQRGFA